MNKSADEAEVMNPLANQQAVAERPVTTGLVSVEQQRAVAEVQARMMIARANPRDAVRCMDLILQDCMRPSLAEVAVYQYSRGGSDVTGPSIRLAESVARRWGNIASGIKEISRHGGYSECVAYAWDLETGYYDERQFQVRHWRDTRKGGYALEDERDIYELTANMGQRRKRAVLLSVIPGDVIEAAVTQCEATLKAKADTSPEAIQKMLTAFEPFGVTKEHIEKRIQRRLDAIQPAQVVSLKKIYASLRDGMSVAAEWFELEPRPAANEPKQPSGNTALKEKLRAGAAKAADPAAGQTSPEAGAGQTDEKAAAAGAPVVTKEQLITRFRNCNDIDVLDADASLIGSLPDVGEQQEAVKVYKDSRAKLAGK